ncbi:MAG: flagellin FliC [Limnochordaceae bacterium]|nr:flagellin FliC [Limnochordaceae bacterium]
MVINTNISALQAWRNLQNTDTALNKSLERLSTGLRINRAADDAAGLTVSEKMKAQINGLNQAVRNAQDGISLLQTAEGGLSEIQSLLQRQRELAVQAASDTLSTDDRSNLDLEFKQLSAQIDEIAKDTQFNTKAVLFSDATYTLQVGANTGQILEVSLKKSDTTSLSIDTASIGDITAASAAIASLDDAIKEVSKRRADIGAKQNRLEHIITNLQVQSENMAAANSRIRDVDMAAEMMNFTKQQILMQAGTAMLQQANANPQMVLKLLQG